MQSSMLGSSYPSRPKVPQKSIEKPVIKYRDVSSNPCGLDVGDIRSQQVCLHVSSTCEGPWGWYPGRCTCPAYAHVVRSSGLALATASVLDVPLQMDDTCEALSPKPSSAYPATGVATSSGSNERDGAARALAAGAFQLARRSLPCKPSPLL